MLHDFHYFCSKKTKRRVKFCILIIVINYILGRFCKKWNIILLSVPHYNGNTPLKNILFLKVKYLYLSGFGIFGIWYQSIPIAMSQLRN